MFSVIISWRLVSAYIIMFIKSNWLVKESGLPRIFPPRHCAGSYISVQRIHPKTEFENTSVINGNGIPVGRTA